MKDTEKGEVSGKLTEESAVAWENTEKVDSSADVDKQVKDVGCNEALGLVLRTATEHSEESVFLMNSEMSV